MEFILQHQNDPIDLRIADIKRRIDSVRRKNGWWPYDKIVEEPATKPSNDLSDLRAKLKPRTLFQKDSQ